jgi:hypothetical protein
MTIKKMVFGAFVFLGGIASFQVFATEEHKFGPEADQYCPKLPEGSGYSWEWVFSVDWGHCIGRAAKTHTAAFDFGIARLYGVMPPSEIEPETAFVKSGSVGGTPVRWYGASRPRSSEKLEYRTFALLNEENMAYLSVSVYAASESQMNERLKVLERLKRRCPRCCSPEQTFGAMLGIENLRPE